MKRASGVLMPIFSLPSKYSIGGFSKEAYQFVDWLKLSGQSFWQMLPLGPTGYGDSPYQSFSSFAGNPYFISLDDLITEGLLSKSEVSAVESCTDKYIDYEKLYKTRYDLLYIAFKRFVKNDEYAKFIGDNEYWLTDYAIFMSIKAANGDIPFYKLDSDIIKRNREAIEAFVISHGEKIEFYKFIQFKFYQQWNRLKKYANDNGIKIIGDVPIYVSYDSQEVWCEPNLFMLDDKLIPTAVAGCPPDNFAPDGQLWGNPLYNWEYHENTGYKWWKKRFSHALKMYDVIRIDHFRGFVEFFAIPYGENTAKNGIWLKGPGEKLFCALDGILTADNVIAEDLGFITEDVRELLKYLRFPGMKIVEFGFDKRDNDKENTHLPHNYPRNSVVYTSTHDNQTLISWYKSIDSDEKHNLRRYLYDNNTEDDRINEPIISLCMRSVSDLAIVPIWDLLGFSDEARINIPSTRENNWRWRLDKLPSIEISSKLFTLTKTFGR